MYKDTKGMEHFFLWVNKRGTLSVKSGTVYKRVRGGTSGEVSPCDEDECGTFLNLFTVKFSEQYESISKG